MTHVLTNVGASAMRDVLTSIWREVLGVATLGDQDDFFEVGGDSRQMMAIIAQIQSRLDGRMDLLMFLDNPVLGDLATALEALTARGA